MKPRRLLLTVLCSLCLASNGFAAETAEHAEKKQASEEEIKARLAEHAARKKNAAEADAKAEAKAGTREENSAAIAASPAKEHAANTAAPAPAPAAEAAKAPADDSPALLPRVDVRKDRITELDVQLAKQNKEIAREKENTKPTALDETINSPKLSKIFGIFGGQSSDDRSNIAKERVAMMEEEKEILEAIAQARTKEEKAQLEKLLSSMKAMRRELEQSLR